MDAEARRQARRASLKANLTYCNRLVLAGEKVNPPAKPDAYTHCCPNPHLFQTTRGIISVFFSHVF